MANILLTRIDNRLVHGQVGSIWTSSINANLLLVVDDDVANDSIQQQLMTMSADQAGVGIRFFSIEKTINVIEKASDSQKIFIIAKNPMVVRKLIEGGLELKDINVGNMHFSEGKRQLSDKVFVDDDDMANLHFLQNAGLNLFIQDVPSSTKKKINF